ncbi:MAG: preprotein translocase subunit SecA [Planctomycetota bacterium]|nr:preprotein translocase subunit SecA [Planctomycetota bacterium]
MIGKLIKKVFGTRNDRVIKAAMPIVERVNALEPEFHALTDEQLRGKTDEFRRRLADDEDLDRLLPEAFAAVREASKRTLGMRHFDVQLIGGWCLHNGSIAEMTTGEGKTLSATLAVYLNALPGRGSHVVTVNDYLAKRDAEWMMPVYEAVGMTCGFIQSHMRAEQRQVAYGCDITYGTNSEFGFDYLRDNMKVTKELQVQRHRQFAVVDEVDSILIDEARTPLIITGQSELQYAKYEDADKVARRLKPGPDFEVKEKEHQCILTDDGMERAEGFAGLSFLEEGHTDWLHLLEQSLRAHHIYKRDKDYVVKDGEIVIVDEFTGRMMEGRRWSDGLHQAVEAKEHIRPRPETQTLATITYQNFFKLYDKLAGMTGTALTEAAEFWSIYGLDVVSIPTNRPMKRILHDDLIYANEKDKYAAVVEEIVRVNKEGRPILVGTTSIEKSEQISGMLSRRGIEHVVLNAKQHEREALIVENAGLPGAVTIATNMAGRGTDIKLGQGVKTAGGLHIVGTERHESRRIDNQLLGRSGRQGDPGSCQFFLSLGDDLMRIFAPDWVASILGKLGLRDGEAIAHPMVSKAIIRAQKKVEGRNYEIRKNLLEYDEVMDIQRKEVYSLRNALLEEDEERQQEIIEDFIAVVIGDEIDRAIGKEVPADAKDPEGLASWFRRQFAQQASADDVSVDDPAATEDRLTEIVRRAWRRREEELTDGEMRAVERFLLLNSIDAKWKDHLHAMDGLKTGIGMRAYGQMDPKVEYKVEGHRMFSEMLASIRDEVTENFLKVRFSEEASQRLQARWSGGQAVDMPDYQTGVGAGLQDAGRTDDTPIGSAEAEPAKPFVREQPKVGRNDPCPCGSGKKYKKCHGANA